MKQKDIIFILASAFFVIVVWIIFTIYHNTASSTISEKLNIQIVPITASFDLKAIDAIKKRDNVQPLYTGFKQNTSLTPTPSSSSSPTLTPIPTGTINNQATTGGTLSQ